VGGWVGWVGGEGGGRKYVLSNFHLAGGTTAPGIQLSCKQVACPCQEQRHHTLTLKRQFTRCCIAEPGSCYGSGSGSSGGRGCCQGTP
jgi:hypothetical protein